MKHAVGRIGCVALICCLEATPGTQAQQEVQSTSSAIQEMPATLGGHSSWINAYLSILSVRMANERRKEQNADRQKRLESDTNRLMDMVGDLQRQMQGEKELSSEDLSKRAAEIEKLARSVREHMSGDS